MLILMFLIFVRFNKFLIHNLIFLSHHDFFFTKIDTRFTITYILIKNILFNELIKKRRKRRYVMKESC